MASFPKPLSREKRLLELLEEQQEPFLLDAYLLEHGCSKRKLRPKAAALCWPSNACKRLLRQSSHGIRRRGGFLRCMLSKLLYGKLIHKAINWECVSQGSGRMSITDCFFSMGRKSDVMQFSRLSNTRAALDGELRWECVEDNDSFEQLSPMSVLELHSYDDIKEEISSNSSANAEELSQIFEEFLKYVYHSPLPQGLCTKTKCVKDQSERLITDCVKEVEEKLEDRAGCLDAKRTEKNIVDKHVLSWENQRADISSITQLVDADFSSSRKEWSHFQSEMREIGIEIETLIFDDIREEIVLAMLDFQCTK